MLVALLGLAVLAPPPDLRPPPTPVAGGNDDQVDILEPEDGAYYPDVPTAVDVTVEVTNNSALEIQDVSLEVNGQAQDTMCEGAGNCEWTVTLDEGVHEFRSVVVRNIGGPLFSQFVTVQVGGDPPNADGGTGDDDDDDDTGGTGEDSGSGEAGEDSGGDSGEPAEMDDEPGCACTTSPVPTAPVPPFPITRWAWLLLPLAVRRRL